MAQDFFTARSYTLVELEARELCHSLLGTTADWRSYNDDISGPIVDRAFEIIKKFERCVGSTASTIPRNEVDRDEVRTPDHPRSYTANNRSHT